MISTFVSFRAGEEIPVLEHLRDRKLAKYMNRETMAAIVALGRLRALVSFPPEIPFYYATGMLEYEDYGLREIVSACCDGEGRFSSNRFIEEGIASVSPLNQFKILQNMPQSFASINFGLTGDNAVIYSAAGALLRHAGCAPGVDVLIGAGKAYRTGDVESGFGVVSRERIAAVPLPDPDAEAVEIFRRLATGREE